MSATCKVRVRSRKGPVRDLRINEAPCKKHSLVASNRQNFTEQNRTELGNDFAEVLDYQRPFLTPHSVFIVGIKDDSTPRQLVKRKDAKTQEPQNEEETFRE